MTYTYTLCWNLFNQVEKAVERLYNQNEHDFVHTIVSLGFPLIKDEIPENIEEAKEENKENLKALAARFGCKFLHFDNIGVSQNTQKVYEHINPKYNDVLVSVCPDEIQNEHGWVNALAKVLQGGLAYCAPMLTEHKELLATSPHAELRLINGQEVYVMNGSLNYGTVAFSCGFIKKMGGIPYPSDMEIYGGLEFCLRNEARQLDMEWGILKNFTTTHTDFEKGTPNTSSLLRLYKNDIVLNGMKQITLDQWLIKKKNGEL